VALGNLASRFLVAVVAAPLLLLVMYQPYHWITWGVIFAASLVCMYELFAMMLPDVRDRRAGLIFGGLACAALYWGDPSVSSSHPVLHFGPYLAIALGVIGPLLYYLFRFRDMATAAPRIAATITGVVYAGFLATFLAMFKRDHQGAVGGDLILLVLLATWLGDTGAYFAGRFLGRSKLYEAVSPKKTWAGALGGLAASLLAVVLVKLFRLEELAWIDVVLIALPGAALAQLGDLAESVIKRSTGVKDSGAILPGHGGLLDRLDAVLFMAPYVYLYLQVRAQIAIW
jgi:phosphatidate cytidylyltransferase